MEKFRIMDQAESFYFPGNEVGVLIVHGFTGTTQSMRDLGKQIANEGYTVYGPRLTGHGTHPEDMEKAQYTDWINDVKNSLDKLQETCSAVFVIGLSMGGTLTLYIAENHPGIAGIVTINAAIDMPDLKENFNTLKNGKERFVDGIGSDIKKEDVAELAYDKTPVRAMGELVALMEKVRQNLADVTVPTLIFSSTVDHVVPPANSRQILESISTADKDLVRLENSYHVATLDHDKDVIADKCIAFIEQHSEV
ncbi:MAG TPA: alpha/beta fold hydrolase [Bacillota bacterium]|nr:alpha/beta fold hydrolase [Bacillota bacterium]